MGTFAFGGVYSMLSFFEKELVEKKKWLTHDEFTESVAMGQMTPGAPIVNTGIFIGYRLAGFKGGVTTVIGQTLPSFIIIVLFATIYLKYHNLPVIQSTVKGIGAGVIGLIFSVVFNMGKKTRRNKITLFLFIFALAFALFLKINPILILAFGAFAGIALLRNV